MKKYFFALLVALVIGFFLADLFISQYTSPSNIKVSNIGEELYFVQYGVFSTKESMEENTISLENYVYSIEKDLYYVYIGITRDSDNVAKIQSYFNDIGYDTIVKIYYISNKSFLEQLKNYDNLLKETTDKVAISSIINQVLIKYEEVVISGSQN